MSPILLWDSAIGVTETLGSRYVEISRSWKWWWVSKIWSIGWLWCLWIRRRSPRWHYKRGGGGIMLAIMLILMMFWVAEDVDWPGHHYKQQARLPMKVFLPWAGKSFSKPTPKASITIAITTTITFIIFQLNILGIEALITSIQRNVKLFLTFVE